MPNLTGLSLGRYQLLEPLGEGGMAIVYKAYDTRLECDVAVKIIRTENLPQSGVERALKRFEREAKSVAKLTHANIVRVMDYGEHEGNPYLVMPYLPGGTLKELNKQRGQTPWQEAVQLLIPIAEALGYAHSQGIIHRDIKPSNILLTTSGSPMLTDFGVAKIIDEEATQDLTGTSATVGTPEYMAPEQITSKMVDARADLYALGVVFYELITGRKPFEADTPLAVLFKQASEPLPRPSLFVKDLPESVEKFLIKALAKAPADRYQTAEEMVAALKSLSVEKVGVLPLPPPKPDKAKQKVETSSSPSQNKKPLWIGLTLLGVVVLVAGGFLLSKVIDKNNKPISTVEQTRIPTTLVPTITSTLTPTIKSTNTPTPTTPPTLTSTPLPIYTEFQTLNVSLLDSNQMIVTLRVKGIQGEYFALLDGATYKCNLSTTYEDRVDCIGSKVNARQADFQLILVGTDHVVLNTSITIPYEEFLCGDDVTGSWSGTYTDNNNTRGYTLYLQQNNCNITGHSNTEGYGGANITGSVSGGILTIRESGVGDSCFWEITFSIGSSLSGTVTNCGGGHIQLSR